jgi:hypothetical protein
LFRNKVRILISNCWNRRGYWNSDWIGILTVCQNGSALFVANLHLFRQVVYFFGSWILIGGH